MADESLDDVMKRAQQRLQDEQKQRAATPDELGKILNRAQQQPENKSGGVMGSIDAFMRHAADRATFGGADAAKGAIDPTSSVASERAITKQQENTNPYASLAGDIAGTIVPTTIGSKFLGGAIPALAKPTATAGAIREGIVGGAQPIVDAYARGEPIKWGEVLSGSGISGALGAILPTAQKFLPAGKISQFAVTEADKEAMKALGRVGEHYNIPMSMPEMARGAIPGKSGQIEAAYNTATSLPKGSVARTDFEAARQPARELFSKQIDAGTLPFLQARPGVSPGQAGRDASLVEKVVSPGVKPPIDEIQNAGGMMSFLSGKGRNMTSGALAKKMQDPSSIDMIGKRTPGLELAQGAATAAGDEQDLVDQWMQSLLDEQARKSRRGVK
jgi:hypothetical protein